MLKLILPNSAPPGQESQKCLENKCTEKLRLWSPRAGRKVFFSLREVTNTQVFRLSRGDEVRPRGDESSSFLREVTKAVHLFSRHFWLSRPGGAELGKMSFTIEFVYENYKF